MDMQPLISDEYINALLDNQMDHRELLASLYKIQNDKDASERFVKYYLVKKIIQSIYNDHHLI
jgi:hypothetical protein